MPLSDESEDHKFIKQAFRKPTAIRLEIYDDTTTLIMLWSSVP